MKIQLDTDVHIDGIEALAAQASATVEQALQSGRRTAISSFQYGRAAWPTRTAPYPGRIAASLRRNMA